MKKNKKVLDTLASEHQDIDIEDLEMPKYLEKLEKDEDSEEKNLPKKTLTHFVEDIWVPQPELVEKSLAQLEKEDKIYRKRITQSSDTEKIKALQLNIQRQLYRELLEIGVKIHQLSNFTCLEEFKINITKLLKSLIRLQNKMSPFSDGKIKSIKETSQKMWEWMAGLARE